MVSLAELETVFKSDCLGAQTHARHAVIGSIDDLNGGGIRNSQFAQPQRQGSPRLQHGFRDWTEHRMPSEAREVCGSKPVAWREETTIAGIVASSQARAWSYRAGRRRRRVGFGLGSVRVCQLFDFPGLQRLFVLVLVLVFSFSFSLFVFTFLSLSLSPSLPPSLPPSLSLSLSLSLSPPLKDGFASDTLDSGDVQPSCVYMLAPGLKRYSDSDSDTFSLACV